MDSISRQDAIDAIDEWLGDCMNLSDPSEILGELPSARITVEELKQIANEMGYNIIKRQEYIKLLPCKCGCNSRSHWCGLNEHSAVILVCRKCGARAQGKNKREAKLNWNRMVSEDA